MEICTVDEYNAPADSRAIVANIRTSALAAGWTVEEYRSANEVWGWDGWAAGPERQWYDIAAGYNPDSSPPPANARTGYNGCFLQLKGTGFGNQGPNNRWRLFGFTTDHYQLQGPYGYGVGECRTLDYGAKNVVVHGWPTQQSYTSTGHVSPHHQNNKIPLVPTTYDPLAYYINTDARYQQSVFSSLGAIKQWVITLGTKLIHNIINVDNVYIEHSTFGVIDLFDTTHVGGYYFQKMENNLPLSYAYNNSATWSYATTSYGFNSLSMLVNGSYVTGYLDSNRLGTTRAGSYYDNIILQNTWSGKRVIHHPVVHTTLGGLLCPVGRMWYGILNTENLLPGQVLTYGAEEYQVWPVYSATYPNTYGVAYRIA